MSRPKERVRCPAYVLQHAAGEFEECTCPPGVYRMAEHRCFWRREEYLLYREEQDRLQRPWLAKREAKRLAEVGT